MLRYLFVFSCAALAATAASAANVGDPCTGGAVDQGGFGLHCGADGKLQFCDTQNGNVVAEQDCTFPDPSGANPAAAPNGVCEPQSCQNVDGDGCTAFSITGQDTCDSGSGEACSGIAVWFDQDTSNDNQLGIPGCQSNAGCVTGGQGEVCDATVPVCNDFGIDCSGNVVRLCLFGQSEDANNNGTLDAGEDKNANGALDSYITPGAFGLDCASAFTAAGTCNGQATDGPLHQALAAQGLNVAGAAFADCDVPQTGGEGEGEGEGEGGGAGDHCAQDSECGRDQVCDNGTCKAASDAGQPPPGCSDAGTGTAAPLAGLLALVGLVPLFRRRRA